MIENKDFIGGHSDDPQLLAALLTDKDPDTRLLGRLLATDISAKLEQFVESEEARGTPRDALFLAVLKWAIQSAISISGPGRDAASEREIAQHTAAFLEKQLVLHFATWRKWREEQRR